VRDVLSQRWILTDGTYDRENPKLAHLKSYLEADQRPTGLYADGDAWACKAILNVVGCEKFSSDHKIAQYAAEIWRVKPSPAR
jgi:starch phosphorylase